MDSERNLDDALNEIQEIAEDASEKVDDAVKESGAVEESIAAGIFSTLQTIEAGFGDFESVEEKLNKSIENEDVDSERLWGIIQDKYSENLSDESMEKLESLF